MTQISPRNTTAAEPIEHLMVAMIPGGAGIEAQEAQGQRELLASTTLPSDIDDQNAFEALGFTFGPPVEGDPLFREATLPEGWKREGSEHAMWSYIVDARGIRRVNVFYKAAFYDRRAHMGLENVGYSVASEFIYGDAEAPSLPAVLTEDERAGVRATAERYLADAERSPDIYADRAPRARALLDAAR
jgi:hypothetical protein